MKPNPPPPSDAPRSNPMRIGPFWKRSADAAMNPSNEEPFDALTDLFLGEVSPSRTSPVARASTPPVPPSDGPVLRLAGVETDDEYQLAPSQREVDPRNVPTRAAAPVLVMDREDEGEARAVMQILPPPARTPVLECLVLGNLPVLASAWASQYVREIAAAAKKPVAYMRMQGEFVGLELVGVLPEGVNAPRSEESGSLENAIDAAAEITDRWIIRCDAGQESIVAANPLTRALTILTGTDQMAREGCKGTFAALAEKLPKDEGGVMVRLAVMGSGGAETKAAGDELAAIAAQTLRRAVPAIICAGKIAGVKPPHLLFSGQTEMGLRSIIENVARSLAPESIGEMFAPPPPVRETRVEAKATPIQQVAADVEVEADVFAQPLPEMKPTMAEIAAGFAEPEQVEREQVEPEAVAPEPVEEAPVVRTYVPPAPAPRRTVEAAAPAPTTLAAHLVELKSLPLRCPYADGIEIAVDEAGMLHLLARSSSESGDDAALASLLIASSWTEAHAGLLAAGVGSPVAALRSPTLHLFTDRPKRSRRLLETNLRVHLLAEVRVGHESAWYCTELN